jgi:hypothetical protein
MSELCAALVQGIAISYKEALESTLQQLLLLLSLLLLLHLLFLCNLLLLFRLRH